MKYIKLSNNTKSTQLVYTGLANINALSTFIRSLCSNQDLIILDKFNVNELHNKINLYQITDIQLSFDLFNELCNNLNTHNLKLNTLNHLVISD